jgi:hypothetical protein
MILISELPPFPTKDTHQYCFPHSLQHAVTTPQSMLGLTAYHTKMVHIQSDSNHIQRAFSPSHSPKNTYKDNTRTVQHYPARAHAVQRSASITTATASLTRAARGISTSRIDLNKACNVLSCKTALNTTMPNNQTLTPNHPAPNQSACPPSYPP